MRSSNLNVVFARFVTCCLLETVTVWSDVCSVLLTNGKPGLISCPPQNGSVQKTACCGYEYHQYCCSPVLPDFSAVIGAVVPISIFLFLCSVVFMCRWGFKTCGGGNRSQEYQQTGTGSDRRSRRQPAMAYATHMTETTYAHPPTDRLADDRPPTPECNPEDFDIPPPYPGAHPGEADEAEARHREKPPSYRTAQRCRPIVIPRESRQDHLYENLQIQEERITVEGETAARENSQATYFDLAHHN